MLSRTRLSILAPMLAAAIACGGDATGTSLASPARIVFNGRSFAGVWDLYAIDADGGNVVKLTSSPGDELFPSWSPDRRRIAYLFVGPPGGVWVRDAGGGGTRVLYPRITPGHITWSPDGKRLAFAGSLGSGWDIYRVDADGGNPRMILGGPNADEHPSWSPDGSRIVFVREGYLCTMDPSGGALRYLSDGQGNDVAGVDPNWSPDGKRIAFARFEGDGSALWTIAATGGDLRRLTPATPRVGDRLPDWSPDGTRLVFQRSTWETTQLAIVNADGSGARTLQTTQLELVGSPSW